MPDPTITVFGAYWCPDCRRAKQFLSEHLIPYRWVDIEQNAEGEQAVLERNQGKRIIPTIVFEDGSILVEPSNAELARKLGLASEPMRRHYDLVIVGGGPTGLTAAIYAAREGISCLLVERSALGGQATVTGRIDNFPGFPEGIEGPALAQRMAEQARRFEVEILQAVEATGVDVEQGYLTVANDAGGHVHGQAVLLATGARYRRLGVPGEDDYLGAGVHFCSTCDGPFYKGAKEIVVVGGGNSACEEGLHLAMYADRVVMLVRGGELRASKALRDKVLAPSSRIEVRFHSTVDQFLGEKGKLQVVVTRNLQTGETRQFTPAAAFIFIGLDPNNEFVRDFVATDSFGFILTGHDLRHEAQATAEGGAYEFETSRTGVFAAGDVRHGSTKQVASSVGEGAAAALAIQRYLKTV